MISTDLSMKVNWESSFQEQVQRQAYNTAPVEALARTVSYYLRDRVPPLRRKALHFLEMGCGAGPNLIWLAGQGMTVSGVDISTSALNLARERLINSGFADRIGRLLECSVARTPFEDASFDGIVEACVFQHLSRADRESAFAEVRRLLRPGGVFVGYMLNRQHTVFSEKWNEQLPDDPGTLDLHDGKSNLYLTNLGVCHFFGKQELIDLLQSFSIVDPCELFYYLPSEEAEKRGYATYLQSMWTVYAVR